MTRYKYSPDMLADAAAQSTTVAGVLRVLGIRWSGGSHAHISRQLKKLGIDTSHFTGQAHNTGGTSRQRLAADQLLVKLPTAARRTPGWRLKRALNDVGVPERCEGCGNGNEWLGEQLTLHVDHINGDFLDNRQHNLRFLCPNCHSQTPTYAGRNRGVFGTIATFASVGDTQAAETTGRLSAEDLTALLTRVDEGELTATEAAKVIGCARDHVNTMRRRLTDVESSNLHSSIRSVLAYRDAVIAYSLAHPERGIAAIARALREPDAGGIELGYSAVSNILKAAGLINPAARRAAASTAHAEGMDGLDWGQDT